MTVSSRITKSLELTRSMHVDLGGMHPTVCSNLLRRILLVACCFDKISHDDRQQDSDRPATVARNGRNNLFLELFLEGVLAVRSASGAACASDSIVIALPE